VIEARSPVTEKIEELGYGEADEIGPARLRPVKFPVLGEHVCD
jgi:hypothetical protein